MADMKIGIDGVGTAYVSEEPDENGVHHGEMKHSQEPVAVRWTGTEWVEA